MSTPSSGQPDDSIKNLFGDFHLHESRDSLGNSLEAYTEPPAPPRQETPTPPGVQSQASDLLDARSVIDPDLIHGFTFGEGSGADQGASFTQVDYAPPPHPAAKPTSSLPQGLPRPGQTLGGFLIVGELGEGAFARVYLAKQENLGNRLVALKVSRSEGDEPEILARFQHTHIVPIYSVHDDPVSGLRLLCMPYLGGANLAQVLEAAQARVANHANGHSLVEALDAASERMQSKTGLNLTIQSLDSANVSLNSDTRLAPELETGANENVDSTVTSNAGANAAVRSQTAPNAPSAADQPPSLFQNSGTTSSPHSQRAIQAFWSRISGTGRATFPEPPPRARYAPDQPARQFLLGANPIQAAVWIVARLAEGLEHAHSRGLLHRDLKPSNILITEDGTPMLLDFNLATLRRIRSVHDGVKAVLGGTLPYMAPEHLDAFYPQGTTPPETVAEQADLYALGLILFEMIAGTPPFLEPASSLPLMEIIRRMIDQRQRVPSLRAACPQVPWSLDSIVAKCLTPDLARRYARAGDLAEDLRRFLDNLPLKFAPEPSPRERIVKWVRRHPSATSMTSVALLSLVLLCGAGGIIALLSNNLQGVSARLRFRAFQSEFSESQFRLNTTSGPADHLVKGIELAQAALDQEGEALWDPSKKGAWTRWLSPKDQTLLREQMVELILLEARARTYLANRGGSEADQRDALEWAVKWLDRAERIDPRPTPALYGDRARYLAALGLAERARNDRAMEARIPPTNSRDFALLGTSLLVKRDWDKAEAALLQAVALDKRRFWAWFALGYCRFEQGRYLEAAGSFAVCTALEPEFAWPYMNQGLALACAGRLNEALSIYDQALEKNPKFAEALVNRALAKLELNDLQGAEADLNRAIDDLRVAEPNVLAARGEVLARLGRRDEAEKMYDRLLASDPENQGVRIARAVLHLKTDPAAAQRDLEFVLERNPRNARALYVMARLVQPTDRHQALGFVDRALEADPNLADALQLRALLRARLGQLTALNDVDRLTQAPTVSHLYNSACALAILTETASNPRLSDRALDYLHRALDAGFPPAEAAADPDLKPLHNRPEYQEMIRTARGTAKSISKGGL